MKFVPSFARIAAAALPAVALTIAGAPASAQNAFFTQGTFTVDAAHSIQGDAYIGADSNFNRDDGMGHPYNPTVNLVMGGTIGGTANVY